MSSLPPSRTASLAERRASASVRQKNSRPTSAALSPIDQENRSTNNLKRKTATTTTTETRQDVTSQETLIRRTTRSPLKPTESNSNAPRNREGERSQKPETLPTKKPSANAASSSWSPQATLLPPTTAPLACRISVPATFSACSSILARPATKCSLARRTRVRHRI